jgi:heat shock protein HslJ
MKRVTLLIVVVALALWACTACSLVRRGPALEGPTWVLQHYGPPENPIEVLPGTELNAFFDRVKGEVRGSSGCNRYTAGYHVEDHEFTIAMLTSTERACLEPAGVMEQEQHFFAILRDAQSYQFEGGELHITALDGQVLVFAVP